jgi:hypothetical protein
MAAAQGRERQRASAYVEIQHRAMDRQEQRDNDTSRKQIQVDSFAQLTLECVVVIGKIRQSGLGSAVGRKEGSGRLDELARDLARLQMDCRPQERVTRKLASAHDDRL